MLVRLELRLSSVRRNTFDPHYLFDEPEPLDEAGFDELLLDRNRVYPVAMLGEE